jgi:hypothetical protein
VQLRSITYIVKQPQLEVAEQKVGILSIAKPGERIHQEIEESSVLLAILSEPVHQFSKVVGAAGKRQLDPDGQERVNGLGLGHDVQVLPLGDEESAVSEQLDVSGLATGWLANSFRQDPHLPERRGVDRQQLVCLTEIVPAQYDGLGAV